MKFKSCCFLISMSISSLWAGTGNPFYGGVDWGFPMGPSLNAGLLIPRSDKDCQASDFGNMCMGFAFEGEGGLSGARGGLGWAFVWSDGYVGGFGAFLSYLYQDAWIKGAPGGPWSSPQRQLTGLDFSLSAFGFNTRFGPYIAVDPKHKGDFVFRGSIGTGF